MFKGGTTDGTTKLGQKGKMPQNAASYRNFRGPTRTDFYEHNFTQFA